MDIFKKYATDATLEKEGVWVDIGEGARVRVARSDNPNFVKCLQSKAKPYRVQSRNRTLSDEVANKVLIETMAETILLDWDGIQKDGKTLPYSKENAVLLLTDLKDFRRIITELADESETFRKQEMEESEKNLKPSSGGK